MLQKQLSLFCDTLDEITMSYKKGWAGDSLSEAIDAAYARDIERGATTPGPHKADLFLTLNGVPARERLSRGEQKAMTAALIMAQAQMICATGENPVLMLDDLSSELDETHLARVLNAGVELGIQIWVTGTALAPSVETCGSPYTVFHVEHGAVSAGAM
jgi:DNA replication and repair protein RecF